MIGRVRRGNQNAILLQGNVHEVTHKVHTWKVSFDIKGRLQMGGRLRDVSGYL